VNLVHENPGGSLRSRGGGGGEGSSINRHISREPFRTFNQNKDRAEREVVKKGSSGTGEAPLEDIERVKGSSWRGGK